MEFLLLLLFPAVFLFDTGSNSSNSEPDNEPIVSDEPDSFERGTDADDLLQGGEGNDTLWGEDGLDRLSGFGGDDILVGGDQADRLEGGRDDDVLIGEEGRDTMSGGSGADVIAGYSLDEGVAPEELYQASFEEALRQATPDMYNPDSSGRDLMIGGHGDDLLLMGGEDTAFGGEGDDMFAVRDDIDGIAVINDFAPGEDTIVVSYDASSLPSITISDDGSGNAQISIDGTVVTTIIGMAGQITPTDISVFDRSYGSSTGITPIVSSA